MQIPRKQIVSRLTQEEFDKREYHNDELYLIRDDGYVTIIKYLEEPTEIESFDIELEEERKAFFDPGNYR